MKRVQIEEVTELQFSHYQIINGTEFPQYSHAKKGYWLCTLTYASLTM